MLTKLDAINEYILDVIGEDPVNSLGAANEDAANAVRTLNVTTREVQAKGWECNRFRTKLQPDVNGHIYLNNDVLRIEPVRTSLKVTARVDTNGVRRLWDLVDETYVFPREVEVEMVRDLGFENLTFELQVYIASKAARRFQASEMGSVSLDSFVYRREQEAYAALLDSESEQDDFNSLRDNPYLARITGRYNDFYGR